jgi:hypothetical protein
MLMNKKYKDLLSLAAQYLKSDDKRREAKELLDEAILLAPTDKRVVSKAISILLYGELYSSARKAYENYQMLTGLKPTLSSTYEDIVQWEQENLMVDDIPVFDLALGSIRFKRMSDLERGSLFSYVTTSTPVEEIEVSEQGLNITQSKVKSAYKWDEITRASIVARTIFKGIGVAGSDELQKIITLEAPGKRFQFDISPTFPDLKGTVLLRTILTRYLTIEEIDERSPGFKPRNDDPIRNLNQDENRRIWMLVGIFLLFVVYLIYERARS